jgi:acetyl-CoA acetyltransferase
VNGIRDAAAIAGVGMTELTRDSGTSAYDLALRAILAALDDAGLAPADVDGIVTYRVRDSVEALEAAAGLGIPVVRWYQEIETGGPGGTSAVFEAALGIAAGLASTVVVFRAMNGRSGVRMGRWGTTERATEWRQWALPYGYMSPPQFFAMWARRHMAVYGTTGRQLGAVAVCMRDNAQRNPRAMFHGRPITIEDHQASRMITDPFRLLDCCLETDGAAAVVLTAAERARHLRHRPVLVGGAANGAGPSPMHPFLDWPDHATMFPAYLADAAFGMAGLERGDVDVGLIYDGFTFAVISQLEDLGFVGKGEGGPFVEGGGIRAGGRLPVNPNGGLLSEGYVHGLNNLIEGVAQLRGEAGERQVEGAEVALVTGGEGARGSVMLLHS